MTNGMFVLRDDYGHLRGHRLQRWIASVDGDDLSALHSFVGVLRRDLDVTAGSTLSWSSGPVENTSTTSG